MQIGIRINGRAYTWDEAFKEAQNPLRPWQLTADLLDLMRIDYSDPDREPGVESFTPTRIMTCHRQAILMERHDYFADADLDYPKMRGHMIHALMEKARYPGAVGYARERRLRYEVDTRYGPQLFTAKPDLMVLKRLETVPFADATAKGAAAAHWNRQRAAEREHAGRVYHNDCELMTSSDYTVVAPPTRAAFIRDWMTRWDKDHPQPTTSMRAYLKVVDYKSKNGIKHELTKVPRDNELQVNMYAWLVSQNPDVYSHGERIGSLAEVLGLPNDTALVVDELEVVYADMARVRTFSSVGYRTDRGKRLNRTKPFQYETLTLDPIYHWPNDKIGRFVTRRIEERLAAKEPGHLPACEYLGTEREYLCQWCPVQEWCSSLERADDGR